MPANPAAASAAPGPPPRAHPSRVHSGNHVCSIWQPCARDSGNKIAVSAHGMREVQTLAFAVRRWRIANTLPKILWKRPAVGRAAAAARGTDSVSGRPSRDARPCRSSRPRHALRRRRRRPSGEREREREREKLFYPGAACVCVCPCVCVCVWEREREREREREAFLPGSRPGGRPATAHSARAQRSRAEGMHRSPATGQRSHP